MVRAAGARVLTGRGGSGAGATEAHSSTGLPEQSCVGKWLSPVVCPRMGSKRLFCFLGLDEADVRSKGLLKLWLLLTFCLFVPVAVGLVLLVLRRSSLRHCLAVEDLNEDK